MSTEDIKKSVMVFEHLRTKRYRITVENGISFILLFRPDHYHHLAGFQHLKDMTTISAPNSKARFYRSLKNDQLDIAPISSSVHYNVIRQRIQHFDILNEILDEGEGKLIIDFDQKKASSEIVAKFLLYKRTGNPFQNEPCVFYNLFIGYDPDRDEYYPATYVVENSRMYVSDQTIYDCKIEHIDKVASVQTEQIENDLAMVT